MGGSDAVDVVVVGRGLFGSAAARHLTEAGASVVAVGPSTPGTDSHRVYSSHDDEARLTRPHDPDERWAPVTARAVAAYDSIAERSGVDFYRPVGNLIATRPGGDDDPIEFLRERGLPCDRWEPGDRGWSDRWPRLDFPTTHAVTFQPDPAGFIRPKRLIAAQEVLTQRAGGVLVDDTVTSVRPEHGGGFRVSTASGAEHVTTRVVVATGAFASMGDVLPEPVGVTVKTEIVILGEVSTADASELADYPTVQHRIDPGGINDIYMTPPLPYPDGKHCIKMGANTRLDTWPTDLAEIQGWFESDTDADHLPLLQPALEGLWPDVEFLSLRTRPCIVTYTPEHYPLIEEVQPGLVVATAGNGGGAKGSDAWGAMAAELALGN